MKGLISLFFCLLTISAHASMNKDAHSVLAIKLQSGEVIENLSLQESTKVLESLGQKDNLEIRNRVIYPEEIASLFGRRLTKGRFTERRPNPQDYN